MVGSEPIVQNVQNVQGPPAAAGAAGAARSLRAGVAPQDRAALAVRARANGRIARTCAAALTLPDGTRLVARAARLQRAGGQVVGDLTVSGHVAGRPPVEQTARDVILAAALRPRWPDESPEAAADTRAVRDQARRLAPLTLLDPVVERWVASLAAHLARFTQDDEDSLGSIAAPVPVDDIRLPLTPDWRLVVEDVRFDGALRGAMSLVGPGGRAIRLSADRPLLSESGAPTRPLDEAVRRAERTLKLRLQVRAAREAAGASQRLGARLESVWWALAACEMAEAEVP